MRWTALMLLAASCSTGVEPSEDAAPLRLGTHFGVAVMDPSVKSSFTRNIIELVYKTPLSAYFSAVRAEGSRVRLTRRDDVPTNLAALAATLTHPDLLAATVDGRDVVLDFRTTEAAGSIDLDSYLIADGPYRTRESTEGHLLLARRDAGGGPAFIDVTAVASAEEEWRRFLSGDFDAMPYVLPGAAAYLQQVPTLRLVRVTDSQSAALWFRMDGGPTQNLELRRAIAGLIRRRALAVSVTGKAADARDADQEDESGEAALLAAGILPERPLVLHLIVPEAQTDLVRAAMVLQQQLDAHGIELRIDALSEPDMAKRLSTHDFDLVLFTGDRTPRYWPFLSPAGATMNGYASEELDAAVKANDTGRARAILDRDLPLTPLFDLGESVAVRRDLCNVHPHTTFDLTWLADLHRCRPGEDE